MMGRGAARGRKENSGVDLVRLIYDHEGAILLLMLAWVVYKG